MSGVCGSASKTTRTRRVILRLSAGLGTASRKARDWKDFSEADRRRGLPAPAGGDLGGLFRDRGHEEHLHPKLDRAAYSKRRPDGAFAQPSGVADDRRITAVGGGRRRPD